MILLRLNNFLLNIFLIFLFSVEFSSFALSKPNYKDWEFNPNIKMAFSLARSGDLISSSDMYEMIRSINETGNVPKRVENDFLRMLKLAQLLIQIKTLPYYFPVGYEFETAHGSKESYDQFKQGAESLANTVTQSFGRSQTPSIKVIEKEGTKKLELSLLDGAKQVWFVQPEYVRENDAPLTMGWEIISPPFFNLDYLGNLSSFILQLAKNQYGQSAELTSGHQTFQAHPMGLGLEQLDSNTQGLIVANYLLIKQQYIATIFNLLKVYRYGGYKNFFIRPIIFDHYEMLKELSEMNPHQLTSEALYNLMHVKYGLKEFLSHVSFSESYSKKDKKKLLALSEKEKLAFPKLWKYHDSRIKFVHDNLILIEDRMGDYRAGEPEYSILITYFNQLLLNKAIELAKNKELFQFQAPEKNQTDSDEEYWKKLNQTQFASKESLFSLLNLDANSQNLFLGKKIKNIKPQFKALEFPSWGFEMEFRGHQFVDIVLPKDLKVRSEWAEYPKSKKIKYLASLISDEEIKRKWLEEGELSYDPDMRRIISIEFEANTLKYPFLDPELYMEDSGNFEIKSNGRYVYDYESLKKQISEIKKVISGFGMHCHLFIPESYLMEFRNNPELTDKAVNLIERVSLYMTVYSYDEVKAKSNYHALDSWSLDRYSPKDLSEIRSWLLKEAQEKNKEQGKEQGQLHNLSQKFHNIGFRVVRGGLDLEGRDLGDDLSLTEFIMKTVYTGFVDKKFIDQPMEQKATPLFYEFQDSGDINLSNIKTSADGRNPKESSQQYTLVHAVNQRHSLTDEEKDLLYKFQFEIYKPSMKEFMRFSDDDSWNSVPAKKLDPAHARTNFENNVVLPLWNFEDQSYMHQKGFDQLLEARNHFIDRVYKLMKEIKTKPEYSFMISEPHFLYLAKWMKRSEHPNKPDLNKFDKQTSESQRILLENLVYLLRSFVVDFVHETKLKKMVQKTLDLNKANNSNRPLSPPLNCSRLFLVYPNY